MKKYFIFILTVMFVGISCQDELESKFPDPGVYTPESNIVPGMFSAMMSRERTFKNSYPEVWWHVNSGGMISHLQFTVRPLRAANANYGDANNLPTFMSLNSMDSYFYGPNIEFREMPVMEEMLDEMSEEEKKDNQIYYTLTRMVRGYRAAKAVDLFNSIPYFDALQGYNSKFFPEYDDPKEIYMSIINDLGTYAEQIMQEEAAMSADAKANFKTQDIIFSGDIEKWVEWSNALRLRLAIRISGVEEAFAKSTIAEIISKGKLPARDLFVTSAEWVTKDNSHWKWGIAERDYAGFVPPPIIYKMDRDRDHEYTPGVDDPRLPVLILPNRDTLYMPVSLDFSIGTKVNEEISKDNFEKYGFNNSYVTSYNYFSDVDVYLMYNSYSLWNAATMCRNVDPWRAFTRAEVDLLLAEAELKGLANTGKSGEEHIKNAVLNSIDYWYYINSFSTWDKIDATNEYFLKPTAPGQDIKEAFANTIVADYTNASGIEGKMEVIMDQKYVHLNLHDYLELISELRRTRYPKLGLMKFSNTYTVRPEVERWPYPGDENSRNMDALKKVIHENNFTSPIFWVPEDKRNVPYYDDDFIDDYLYIRYPGLDFTFK